jgi:hypothetical protein
MTAIPAVILIVNLFLSIFDIEFLNHKKVYKMFSDYVVFVKLAIQKKNITIFVFLSSPFSNVILLIVSHLGYLSIIATSEW